MYSHEQMCAWPDNDGIPDGGSVDLFLLIANPTSTTKNSTIATTIAPRLLINAISVPERS